MHVCLLCLCAGIWVFLLKQLGMFQKLHVWFMKINIQPSPLKAPITTAAEIPFHCFSEKIRFDVSSESSAAKQRIHMKIKPYILRKIKVKN